MNTHPLERSLAIAGAVLCLIVTIPTWWSVSAQQSMWPLPALYFVEMVALGIFSAFAFLRGGPRGKLITWGAVGVFLAFSILGAFSVGFFYLPVAFLFGAAAIISDVRGKQRIAAHVAVGVIAGIAQTVLMFAAIQLVA
jgi:hypothetical protein